MLLTMAAIQFTTVLDFMVIMPLAPQFTRVFGLSAQQFGWLISAYTFAAAIAGIVASVFIDRFERKRLLLVIYVGFVAAAIVTAAAQNLPMLLLARALAGVFGGVLYGVIFTVIGDTIPEARRGRATGVVMTSFAVSTVAGVPIALLLSNAFNWRAAFVLVAASGAINAWIARKTLPNVAHAPATAAGEVRHDGSTWTEFRRTLTFPNHLRAFVFTFLMMISGFMVIPYISLYITSNIGLPEAQLPLVYLAGGVATFFTARWFGRWADRAGKREVYRWIALASIVPLLVDHACPGAAVVRDVDRCSHVFRVCVGPHGARHGGRDQRGAPGWSRRVHDVKRCGDADRLGLRCDTFRRADSAPAVGSAAALQLGRMDCSDRDPDRDLVGRQYRDARRCADRTGD